MQNNGKEIYKKVCCTCKTKVAFLLIRSIVVFHRSPALPSPLSITRFCILFEQTTKNILSRASLLALAKSICYVIKNNANSRFSLGVLTHYMKSVIAVLPLFFLPHHFSLFSIVSQLPSTYTWPLSRESTKTTRRHDILGQLRTVSKFVSGKISGSMDFTKTS